MGGLQVSTNYLRIFLAPLGKLSYGDNSGQMRAFVSLES